MNSDKGQGPGVDDSAQASELVDEGEEVVWQFIEAVREVAAGRMDMETLREKFGVSE